MGSAAVAEPPAANAMAAAAQVSEYVMSTVERARTVASACSSGTLCTSCKNQEGAPFGSHVDYVLDAKGWPVLLLNEQSLHTGNVKVDPRASLFAQMPSKVGEGQPSSAMARVTVMGQVVPVEDVDELFTLRATYSVTHGFAALLVENDQFKFYKLKPERVFYSGGFGVNAQWVDVHEYEAAEADSLALESLALVNKINKENTGDLGLVCSQFVPDLVGLDDLDIKVTTIDRLGMDIRVSSNEGADTAEYRVGFVVKVLNLEDAKSEIVKIFQEAWEKSEGEEWEDMGPPIFKTNKDILHNK